MRIPASIVPWTCRMAVAGLLVACLLVDRQPTYTAKQVHIHRGIVYAKKGRRPADGILVLHDAAGHLLLEGRLRNGILCGTVNEWYPDGRLKTRYEYVSPSIGLGSLVEVYNWYPNGTLAELYQMRSGPNGYFKTGRDLSWYENGGEMHMTTYLNGALSGPEIGWDEGGNRTMKSLHNNLASNVPYLIPMSFKAVGLEEGHDDNTVDAGDDDSDTGG